MMAPLVRSALHKLVYSYGIWVLVLLLLIYGFSGIYKIEQNETGLLMRFGRVVDDMVPPGLHYALPYPIDRVQKFPAKQMNTLVVNDFISDPEDYGNGSRLETFVMTTSLMPYAISGDNNIINIGLLVKYTVINAHHFLLHNLDAQKLISNQAATIVLHTLAAMSVDEILTSGKKHIEDQVRRNLQREMDSMETGIAISFVELRVVSAPEDVQRSFNEVVEADIDQKRNKNDAETFRNTTISSARSEAVNLRSEATSAKQQMILNAQGAARRFKDQQEEYAQNKEIGRRKLYLEVLQTIYPKIKEIRYIEGQ